MGFPRLSSLDEAGDAVRQVIRAYHGSPYDFDRFDASKIGTGEGAQAYGHGLYFAGSEDTARHYRDNLAGQLLIDGQPVTGREPADYVHLAAAIASGKDVSADVAKAIAARDHWASEVDRIRGVGHDQDGVMPGLGQALYKRGLYQDYLDAYEMIKGRRVARNKGRMYEVELGVPEESLLDWDKPVLSQPAAVRSAMISLGAVPDIATQSRWRGGDSYQKLVTRVAHDPLLPTHGRASSEIATIRMMDAGIPGIRYLDQGSRAAGEGTRNYVIFPGAEDSIRILRKFAVPGVVGTGAAAMSGEE